MTAKQADTLHCVCVLSWFMLLVTFAPNAVAKKRSACAEIKPAQQLSDSKKTQVDGTLSLSLPGPVSVGGGGLSRSKSESFSVKFLGDDDLARGWYVYQLCVLREKGLVNEATHQELMRMVLSAASSMAPLVPAASAADLPPDILAEWGKVKIRQTWKPLFAADPFLLSGAVDVVMGPDTKKYLLAVGQAALGAGVTPQERITAYRIAETSAHAAAARSTEVAISQETTTSTSVSSANGNGRDRQRVVGSSFSELTRERVSQILGRSSVIGRWEELDKSVVYVGVVWRIE